MSSEPRPWCPRCRRPLAVCVCPAITPVTSATRVVFLQHPREARMPVSTCRLAHLSLPNSELHVGLAAESNPRLEAIARSDGAVVLFPGPDAVDVHDLAEPPRTLVVVDGTWSTAAKIVRRSPLLAALPRVGFVPERPGNYRIRREPAPEFVSTIEAVVYALGALERAPERFAPMLDAFTRMVDQQLAYARGPERRPRRAHGPPRATPIERVLTAGERLVLVFVHTDGAGAVTAAAHRPFTGERFDHAHAPGGTLAEPWRAFARPDDLLVSWGTYAFEHLAQDGVSVGATLDLKHALNDARMSRSGGVEALALALGAELPTGRGRPARQLAAAEAVLDALRRGVFRARPPAG